MAITGDPYSSTDLQYTIPEVWTPEVDREFFPKSVAANWFTDLSKYASEGDTFHVPDIYSNTFTAKSQSTQGAEITTESVAQSEVQLSVDTHKYISFLIGDKDARQLLNSFDFNLEYTRKAGGTLRKGFESALFGLWSNVSTNTVGTTSTVITDLNLREALAKLDSTDVELEDIAWFFHPNVYWKQISGIQKLYDASQRGTGASVTVSGNFGPMENMRNMKGILYDAPIFTSSQVVSGLQTYRNLLAHKRTFCYGNQTPAVSGGNSVRVQANYELRNIGTLAVVDMVYGVKTLRESVGVLINSNLSATTS